MNSPIMSRLEAWYADRDARIAFNIRRKQWARTLLRMAKLSEPGQETSGEFEGTIFRVWIGPRGGTRISPIRRVLKPLPPPPPSIGSLPILDALTKAGI